MGSGSFRLSFQWSQVNDINRRDRVSSNTIWRKLSLLDLSCPTCCIGVINQLILTILVPSTNFRRILLDGSGISGSKHAPKRLGI
ncbi:MAG: hypothetical protein US98_C0027G0005 [Parcubacteria group bacterium GW2011_GWC1_38_6]|nr:MAG: hypothetical protein US98_C0027G0005 [Parcubacteria group bacterium GW2011_GWC1_38_6]